MSSQSSNFDHIHELGVSVKNFPKVLILQTVDLQFVWDLACHVPVVISYLEDKTDITDVASLVKLYQWLISISAKDMSLALLDEVDSCAHHPEAYQTIIWVDMLVLQRGTNHWDQFVVCLESELRVLENDLKPVLELQKKISPHNFDLHIFRDFFKELVLSEESVRTTLEVL